MAEILRNPDSVSEIRIINPETKTNLFDIDEKYTIPLYQRAYAWEEKQLHQLIDDIKDISDETDYCIGSLIVSRHEKDGETAYEVVDGQQRLTSLYLLLHCLGQDVKPTLRFTCRERSNYTLDHMKDLLENREGFDESLAEPSIRYGISILQDKLHTENVDEILRKLSRVVLYRIELPEHTDLNRYFEIMNTRGEQLEPHDILKATLMSYFEENDAQERNAFAMIWDACSDMSGYVQMHFHSDNNEVRDSLFGKEWNSIPPEDWSICCGRA